MSKRALALVLTMVTVMPLTGNTASGAPTPVKHVDRPFVQDFSEKHPLGEDLQGAQLFKVRADRNGRLCVLSDRGLLQIQQGKLVPDKLHRPLGDMKILDLIIHRGQFVYLTENHVLSNAWAGRLFKQHEVAHAGRLALGENLSPRVVDNRVEQIAFDARRQQFLILSRGTLRRTGGDGREVAVFKHDTLACFEQIDNSDIRVGTTRGTFCLDAALLTPKAESVTKLPCPDIRCIRTIGTRTWFGTPRGAFALKQDGTFDYYASGRWLVDDHVVDIAAGPENSVLILSRTGLSIIHFQETTLAQKAGHFDRLTRQRHIRYGFNSALVMSEPGDLATGTLIDQDNDGLWTAMYLAGELFRYAVTKSAVALQNCHESFDALERLTEITPMAGFPARSFDHKGYQVADLPRWQPAADKKWVWKATTSSDEIVGHFFAYALFAEFVSDPAWRRRAIALMDAIMDHIVQNNGYLIDFDGKPTRWGRWHPDYVNQFPKQVGDRRLNSVQIIAFLQTAYHFTKKDIYREKAFELLTDHGYLENIMIPIDQIGRVPGIDLTSAWNHSDDELAFLSYWLLYHYAFDSELQEQYRQTIEGHWRVERPERNPLWNFIYASTGARQFDLAESIWSLQEFPLDTIGWSVQNSQRQDLNFLPNNFRRQTTEQVLPPDERPMSKYNGNAFRLDGGEGGRREFSGDIYLLPYWLGRHLGVLQ